MEADEEIIELLREIRDLLAAGAATRALKPDTPARKHPRSVRGHTEEQPPSPDDSGVEALLAAMSDAGEWNSVWEGGSPLDKWLAVLAIAEQEVAPQTRLSGPEIARVLTERFRVGGVHGTNVNRDLKKARHYAARRKRGIGFEYWLTRAGLSHIAGRRDQLSS